MKNIKVVIILALLVFGSEVAMAQKMPSLDKSPHDIAYFPRRGGDKVARVLYGRPQMKERAVFGKLIKYGKVWRTGANESTEITFYKDVKINGKELKAGTYALFSIPQENNWTIIFNSDLHQWGAYTYKDKYDILRTTVPSSSIDDSVEALTMMFHKVDNGIHLVIAWEETKVEIPIEVL